MAKRPSRFVALDSSSQGTKQLRKQNIAKSFDAAKAHRLHELRYALRLTALRARNLPGSSGFIDCIHQLALNNAVQSTGTRLGAP